MSKNVSKCVNMRQNASNDASTCVKMRQNASKFVKIRQTVSKVIIQNCPLAVTKHFHYETFPCLCFFIFMKKFIL